MATNEPPQVDDEEARLREVLSKKKIIQKQIRRRNSTDPPVPGHDGHNDSKGIKGNSENGARKDNTASSDRAESLSVNVDGKRGENPNENSDSKIDGKRNDHSKGSNDPKNTDKDGNKSSGKKASTPANENLNGNKTNRSNRRSRRRRRRNRAAARIASRNMGGMGGRGGMGGPPFPDSRSYYGGGDYRGPPGPGFYGDRDRDRGWDRDRGERDRRGHFREPSYGRDGRDGRDWDRDGRDGRNGEYYGKEPDNNYREDRGRKCWHFERDRDPYRLPSRGRGPPPGGKERGRSRSISSRSYSRSSSRSYSLSSCSRSSNSRSYSSRSRSPSRGSRGRRRSRSYSRSLSRSRSAGSRSCSRSRSPPSRSRSISPMSGSDKKRKRRDRSHSSDGGKREERDRSNSPNGKSENMKKLDESGTLGQRSRGDYDAAKEKEPANATSFLAVEETPLTKDQRTIFVSQLVMRADERDIRRYFKRKVNAKVRDVIMLRDKRTGRHKGCAYVELGNLSDVERALAASGKNPDFQRFPILIKRTEAEKNYMDGLGLVIGGVAEINESVSAHINAAFGGTEASAPVQFTADGKRVEAQKVYVGSIDRCVTQAQIFTLFSAFGPLDKVLLQMEPTTGISRGFAFLSFRDPKDANLAIQTMSGQLLAGRPLKTGWANQQSSAAGVEEVTSDQFPHDASEKIRKAHAALTTLTGSGLNAMLPQVESAQQQYLLASGTAALGILPTAQVASMAEAALDMALGEAPQATVAVVQQASGPPSVTTDAKIIGRNENPSKHILVRNMYDKDEETEEGWETDIKLDFEEECAQFGKIVGVNVMYTEPGGKIYASFASIEDATNCARNLAGRWFDKRQLKVEFVDSTP